MKQKNSSTKANLNIDWIFPNWEKIVPILALFIFIAAKPPVNKKLYRQAISTIVIDAGHGGHDPGCNGSGLKEKDVTLKTALALGKKITETMPDVKVIYTRTDDRFVQLWERAEIANKNNADLFISIHCNAHSNKEIHGTETFAMGLHKANDNLEVAKRENEVVVLEDDYVAKYEGFDPSSPISHIYFSLFQHAYLSQSVKLAAKVENNISKGLNRPSRGVKQAGFVVLWKTRMPSILIETGFLSNPADNKYLGSSEGVDELANSIANAVADYKKSFDVPVAKAAQAD